MAVPSLEDIKSYNPWMDGEKFEVPSFKRDIYYEIKEVIGRRKYIVAITGIRRVGKSTLIKQIGNELEDDKFFFSFEEDRFANYDSLKKVVETFIEWGKNPIIFLDEIGRVKGWAGLLKKYHDLNKARFVISGSSSLHITKGKESLAGRLMEYKLPPWQFDEYLKLTGIKIDTQKITLDENIIEKAYLKWNKVGENKIIDFLKKGSFPELVDVEKDQEIRKYIKSTTIDKIVFEDIPAIFAVEEKDKLYDIMNYIGRESGSIVKPSHLGEALEISKDTVKKYVFYLYHAYLIEILPIEGSTIKSFRKPQKIYSSCSSISYALSETYNESMLVENSVCDKLINTFREIGKKIYFYRDPQKHEIDFTGPIVVECKWKRDITSDDLHNLLFYMNKKKIDKAIVVAKEFDIKEKSGKKIFILPLSFFLLSNFC